MRTPWFKEWFGNWEYNPSQEVPVVEVDASRIDAPLESAKAVKEWLLAQPDFAEPVIVKSNGAVVGFTKDGLDASLKRRGVAQRSAYAGLRGLIENSVYFGSEASDSRHPKLVQQDAYYSAMKLGDQQYSVRIKVDVWEKTSDATYKDHKVSKIEVAPVVSPAQDLHAEGGPARSSATATVKISTLTGGVKPDHSKILDENGEPLVKIAQQCGHRQKRIESDAMRQLSYHARLAQDHHEGTASHPGGYTLAHTRMRCTRP